MQLHDLKPSRNSRKRRKIVGRGPGSGHGKTSCRGHRGQKSRSGRGILRTLEGGQMPLIRRIPKVGFRSKRPVIYQLVKLTDLNHFREGTIISAEMLREKGKVKNIFKPFKVLGEGELKKSFTIEAYCFSKAALEKITKAGGKAQTIDATTLKARTVKTDSKN
jgi:large subunit ribosomal protein L15